jgi:hypothetical protein
MIGPDDKALPSLEADSPARHSDGKTVLPRNQEALDLYAEEFAQLVH